MESIKFFLLVIFNFSFLTFNCYSQQYGWVDISNNLPSSNGTASLSDMYWISDNEGWICSGDVGEIYHTTDGGLSYTIQTTQYLTYAIHMLNSLVGYSGGLNGRVYKTTDGGTNWVVHGSIGSTLIDIDFPPNSDSGYCSGMTGKIYKITPTGISAMYTGLNSDLYSICLPTTKQGWACGGTIIVHFNNGIWNTDQAYPSASYNTIYMVNNLSGWAAGDNGIIIHTEDGITWNGQVNPDSLNKSLYDVFFLNSNEGWIVGSFGRVLHTTNGGTIWNIEIDSLTTSAFFNSVQFTSPTNGYIVGDKTLYKYTQITDVEEQPAQPKEFKLEQNYPNPFNPSTRIQYQVSSIAHVTLKVYDILGNEIATLVNEEKSPGIYEVEFQSTIGSRQLASGIYYYQLQAGSFIQTKKMILVK
jgi:photosystem II stability/assembly factor-like uncharacterized protein